MILSLMQPYLFPYLGYFQLIAASDVFVAYDDAQFIKGGWINRNRILAQGKPSWITLPMRAAPHTLPICEREYLQGGGLRTKLVRRLAGAYRGSRNFEPTMALVESIFSEPTCNTAHLNVHALRCVSDALGIRTSIALSSSINKHAGMSAVDKVIHVCKAFGARVYLNSIGGYDLYDARTFGADHIDLRFLEPRFPAYDQACSFVPGLSILDVMMHNTFEEIASMLADYTLRPGKALA